MCKKCLLIFMRSIVQLNSQSSSFAVSFHLSSSLPLSHVTVEHVVSCLSLLSPFFSHSFAPLPTLASLISFPQITSVCLSPNVPLLSDTAQITPPAFATFLHPRNPPSSQILLFRLVPSPPAPPLVSCSISTTPLFSSWTRLCHPVSV